MRGESFPLFSADSKQRAAERHVRDAQRGRFERQHARQRGVDRRGGIAISACDSWWPLRRCFDADGSHEREDRQVRVSHSPDDKSRRFEASPEVPPAVTAHFVRKNRVIPSEKVERCDVDDEPAARLEHARHFGDCLALGRVIERVEHVERRHRDRTAPRRTAVRRRRARVRRSPRCRANCNPAHVRSIPYARP